jgi:hypothetical protein
MVWKEFLGRLDGHCELAPPASSDQIANAEAALGLKLPDPLRDLLRETNGVAGEYGLGLVWTVERILEDNLHFRKFEAFRALYMPFDHLLFFADAGNGDQFAFPIHADGRIHRPDVFVWNHEEDSRSWVAPSLERYLDWWLSGRIKL